ncbi:MAG: AEC family transporter [Pseudomonadota bacterium]
MFATLAAIIAPILIVAAIGYIWAWLKRPFDSRLVTALVTTIGTPSLVASTLTKLSVDTTALGHMALVTVVAFVGFAAVGMVALKLLKLPFHSYLPSLMFPNSGNMGLPLSLFAFGEDGLALAIVFFVISVTLQFTLGIGLAAGSADVRRLLRMPLTYAVALSLLFLATGWPVPKWLANTLELLGGLTIPLMLVALGVSLGHLRVRSLGRALLLSLVRLGAGFIIGLGVGRAFGLEGEALGVVVLQSAMPVAVFNYLFAELYKREPEDVAGLVVVSTVLSFVTLPPLLLFVL